MVELPKLSNAEIIGGAAAIGGIAALGVTAAVIHHKRKASKRKRHKNRSVRKRIRGGRVRRGVLRRFRRTPRTAGKRRDTSHKRIRYTSRGQPYIIGAHGKAKFISRRSAHSSYKRKGGKY